MQGHIFWHRLPRCYRGRDDGSNRPGWLATSLDRFLPVLRSFCFPGHPPLQHLQSLERVFQVARVLNLLPGGEGGCKVLQPEIDTRGGVRRERRRFRIRLPIIDREADKPFPCLRLETVAYFIFPGEDPVEDGLNFANLRKSDAAVSERTAPGFSLSRTVEAPSSPGRNG